MTKKSLNLDGIPLSALEGDLERRAGGCMAVDRVDAFSSFMQKGAVMCLAGILPLGAAREYAPVPYNPGEEMHFEQGGCGGEARGGDSKMDFSTLQDLVSGVGVILTSDFSLPRPSGVRKDMGGRGGVSGFAH